MGEGGSNFLRGEGHEKLYAVVGAGLNLASEELDLGPASALEL